MAPYHDDYKPNLEIPQGWRPKVAAALAVLVILVVAWLISLIPG